MAQYNCKEDFLEAIQVQIRCKKARCFIIEEMEQHIEDQKDAYMNDCDDDKTAMSKACEQMGDPVAIGKQLDRIHRPRMEWSILLAVLVLCSLGILAQISLGNMIKNVNLPNSVNIEKHILFMALGFLLMLVAYFLEYSFIGKYSKILCLLFWIGFVFYAPLNNIVNDSFRYIYPYGLLFIPIYGGILYAYRDKGYTGLIKCLMISIFSFMIELKFVVQCSVYLGILFSSLIMLSIAVIKNWFGTSRKIAMAVTWGWLPISYGLLTLLNINIFNTYQIVRLKETIKALLQIGLYNHDYQINRAINIISHAKLFGGSNLFNEKYIPGFNTEYLLTYIIGKWGLVAGILIIVLFIALIGRMIYLAYHLKNSLGMFVGLGCSLVYALQGSIYILSNLGVQFVAQINLPFVSYGGSSLLINFSVLGLMLSIFRNTNIVKEERYTGVFTLRINRAK